MIVKRPRHDQIEVTSASVLEDSNLVRSAPSGDAPRAKVEQVAFNRIRADDSARDGVGKIAASGDREAQGIGEQAATLHRVVIRLAHRRREAADQVDVCAGLEPPRHAALASSWR